MHAHLQGPMRIFDSKHTMPATLELHVPEHLKPGARLRHYKGGLYRVEGACLIEATLEHPITHKSLASKLQAAWMSTQGDGSGTGR